MFRQQVSRLSRFAASTSPLRAPNPRLARATKSLSLSTSTYGHGGQAGFEAAGGGEGDLASFRSLSWTGGGSAAVGTAETEAPATADSPRLGEAITMVSREVTQTAEVPAESAAPAQTTKAKTTRKKPKPKEPTKAKTKASKTTLKPPKSTKTTKTAAKAKSTKATKAKATTTRKKRIPLAQVVDEVMSAEKAVSYVQSIQMNAGRRSPEQLQTSLKRHYVSSGSPRSLFDKASAMPSDLELQDARWLHDLTSSQLDAHEGRVENYSPDVTLEAAPDVISDVTAEVMRVTSDVIPGVTSDTPDVIPEVASEVTSEVTPEVTPDDEFVHVEEVGTRSVIDISDVDEHVDESKHGDQGELHNHSSPASVHDDNETTDDNHTAVDPAKAEPETETEIFEISDDEARSSKSPSVDFPTVSFNSPPPALNYNNYRSFMSPPKSYGGQEPVVCISDSDEVDDVDIPMNVSGSQLTGKASSPHVFLIPSTPMKQDMVVDRVESVNSVENMGLEDTSFEIVSINHMNSSPYQKTPVRAKRIHPPGALLTRVINTQDGAKTVYKMYSSDTDDTDIWTPEKAINRQPGLSNQPDSASTAPPNQVTTIQPTVNLQSSPDQSYPTLLEVGSPAATGVFSPSPVLLKSRSASPDQDSDASVSSPVIRILDNPSKKRSKTTASPEPKSKTKASSPKRKRAKTKPRSPSPSNQGLAGIPSTQQDATTAGELLDGGGVDRLKMSELSEFITSAPEARAMWLRMLTFEPIPLTVLQQFLKEHGIKASKVLVIAWCDVHGVTWTSKEETKRMEEGDQPDSDALVSDTLDNSHPDRNPPDLSIVIEESE